MDFRAVERMRSFKFESLRMSEERGIGIPLQLALYWAKQS